MRRLVVIAPLAAVILAGLSGCTFSTGDTTPVGDDAPPQVVTATLSEAVRTLAAARTPDAPPTAAADGVLSPSAMPPDEETSVLAEATATPAHTPDSATPAKDTPTPEPSPSAIPSPTATRTPLPTLAPTRTPSVPTALPPLDDGSGNPILGTGNDTVLSPLEGVDELPETLYFLSDVGGQVQVFRLRVGLSNPDQLTYSGTGVQAYSVAPDGTLAYITPGGELYVGGIPAPLPVEPDGTPARATSLAWSPGGNWLAYTLEGASSGGVWMRNRAGNEVQLAANVSGSGGDARAYIGPIDWQPDGSSFIVRTRLPEGTPYTRIAIEGGPPLPLWDSGSLPPDAYSEARWNINGTSVITSGAQRVLRVEPEPFSVTELLGSEIELFASGANQWADGTVMFAGRAEGGATRLYRLAPNTRTAIPITDALPGEGGVDFLWDDLGQEMLLAVYDTPEAQVGTGYLRTADGALHDLTPLTGGVGAPRWGPLFRLRDRARVRTQEGEGLNVRAGASAQASVVIQLATGTRVTIIGGPRLADGYRWWQVRTADGAAGWAVEAVRDARGLELRTLLPVD